MLTPNEEAYISGLRHRLRDMRTYLLNSDIETCSHDALFEHLTQFLRLSGNLSNGRSFGACLLAKRYLTQRFDIQAMDVGEKAQGAKGHDIDIQTKDGLRIIAEIKTTVPYEAKRGDFGANQKKELRKDWEKLATASANYKLFFVTNPDAYSIIQSKYIGELGSTEVVLLRNENLKNEGAEQGGAANPAKPGG